MGNVIPAVQKITLRGLKDCIYLKNDLSESSINLQNC